MNQQDIAEQLLEIIDKNGIDIRYERLGGSGGGLCTIKDKKIMFVDSQATAAETAGNCADALVKIVDINSIYLRPEIRRFVEEHRNPGKSWD